MIWGFDELFISSRDGALIKNYLISSRYRALMNYLISSRYVALINYLISSRYGELMNYLISSIDVGL